MVQMKKLDILVGIPCYNNEKTIAFVVEQVDKGLKQFFPDKNALIVDSDGGSKDGTQNAFESVETGTEKQFVAYKNPVPGKGSAFKEIWEIGLEKGAEHFIVVDSDLRSIRPEWVKKIDPEYSRHRHNVLRNIVR